MGYRTPNIDRIAKEGMLFTDYYAEQSSPRAGPRSSPASAPSAPAFRRSAFPAPRRAAAPRRDDRGTAEAARLLDRAIRENHLGDRNEYLPTVHGFDEFFGNLYHLNAEEEPETPLLPNRPKFKALFGPRRRAALQGDGAGRPDRPTAWGKVASRPSRIQGR